MRINKYLFELQNYKQTVVMFMRKVRGDKVIFEPNRIVMTGGATGASELILFCLADPEDVFFMPTPYYPA